MKKCIVLFLLFNLCTQQSSVSSEQEFNTPELFINCNFINNQDIVNISIEITVYSNSENLGNGSLKGSGIAKDFYRPLENVKSNSSFFGEYIFSTETNGTFSFVLYFDGTKAYRTDCNNEITTITSTTKPKQTSTTTTTTTTTKPKQTSTTTTTTTKPKQTSTTTTVPFTNYKTYTLRSLEMFLEVGFSQDNQITRLNPSDGTLYISTNGNEDEGLDNYVKTIPLLFDELDLNINMEYINNDSSFNIDEIEIWYTNDGYTNEQLEATTCNSKWAITYKIKWDYSNQRWNRKAVQVNVCVAGVGFPEKKAWTLQGITKMLGFIEFESSSKYAGYGGFLQPKFAKNKQLWNEDDKLLIQILYDPRVYEGMTKDEFKEVFKIP
jgi:hypothetical protein